MGRVERLKGRDGWYVSFWDPARKANVRKRIHGTRNEAARTLRDLEAQAERRRLGLDPATADAELAPLISAWQAYNSGRTRQRTWQNYALGLGQVLDWIEAQRHKLRLASDVRLADVEAWKAQALAGGLASRTVAMRVGAVRQMFRWAVRMGHLARNPLAAWEPPRGEPTRRQRALTEFEMAQLLRASQADLADVWRVFLATGLRSGELTSLEWPDVDFEGRRLLVRVVADGYHKTKRERWVPVGDGVLAILGRQRLGLADRPQTEAARRLVFASPRGAHWGNRLRRAMRRCLKAAKLDHETINLHTLRHTAATHMVAAGADVKAVQAILGHSSATVTLDVYAHAVEARKRAAVEALDRLLQLGTARTARAQAASG